MAGGVEIGDRLEPVVADLVGLMVEREPGAGQVVEQSLQLLVIERQPVLHADIAPAGTDRLVEQIIGAGGAKLLAVARAEAPDRGVVEQDLVDRTQCRHLDIAGGTLAQRIEAADALQRVAEEVETQRLGGTRRVEVDNAAADGEFAGFAHRVGTNVAVVAEEALQPVEPDPAARAQSQDAALEEAARRHPLDQGVDRG